MTREAEQDLIAVIRAALPDQTPKMRAIGTLCLDQTERFIRSTSREICAEIGTSEPTLIRFCRQFGYSGLSDFRIDLALSLARQPRPHGFVEPLPMDRRRVNLESKRRIAEHAVTLLDDDDTLLIDNGSTAEFFAAALPASPARTIMTTGLIVAQNALAGGEHAVMLTGGRIRPRALSLTGRQVEATVSAMRFDTFIMGADSVAPDLGFSTFREEEAHITCSMVEAASRVIVLADRTKFQKPALHKICGLEAIDILVTDLPPDHPALAPIAEKGVVIEIVSPGAQPVSALPDAALPRTAS
jgi:DeoR/GlpR family transcriptional regulator of sugar metabolism